jgi:hypothetical protein
MKLQSYSIQEPTGPLRTLVNWLALAMLLALGILAAPAHARTGGTAAQNAFSPVSVRPMVSWWIVSVPS